MERSGMQGRTVYVAVGLGLAFLLGVYFVYPIRVVVLVFLLTLLLSTIMSAPVNYLARQGVSRVWGTLAVFVGLLLSLQLVVEFVIVPLLDQTQRLLADFPVVLAEVRNFINWLEQTTRLDLAEPLYAERLLEAAQDRVSGLSVETVASAGYSIANIVYLVVVILLTSVYAVLQPAPLVRGFVSLFPARRRQQVREMLHKMYWNVQRWLLGQFADKMIVGLLIGLGLWVVGIPFALLLGILTGLLGLIPYVGIVVSLVPPVLLALASDPMNVLWVMVVYLLVLQLEADLIYPVVMSRAVSLHPAAIIFGLFVMSVFFGFVGLLLAVPLVAALQVMLRELWTPRMDRLGTDPNPPPEREEEPARPKVGRLQRLLNVLRRS
ncbi:MAG TPA: AI-2E family transporter [Rubrobacteraceae bacterium]|nr:AI-2E family transporter [Rubrobacteraceae bacterium]